MRFTITAGHGEGDPGNTAGGRSEAALMVDLRNLIARRLADRGHDARTDGQGSGNWRLAQAVSLIQGSAVAIELHTNASSNPQAAGVEVVAKADQRILAQRLAKAIGDVLAVPLRRNAGWYDFDQHARDRGWQTGAAFVRHGGLIVEVFFQSNPTELATYEARRELVAEAIADVLCGVAR